MRRNVLVRSVQRLLPGGTQLIDVVFMWRRRSWMLGGALAAGAVTLAGLTLLDYGSPSSRTMLALAAALIAAVLGTDNRVLASTSDGIVMFEASRIRQVAVRLSAPVPGGTPIEMISSNLVLTEWRVGGERFTVPKRSQQAMSAIATSSGT